MVSPKEVSCSAAKSRQSCLTLCDPIDGSQQGSPIAGILQARTLECVAISFSNAWKWKVKVKLLSRVRLFVTPWTAAYQAPPPMGFFRQEYWSGEPLPSPNACYWRKVKVSKMETSNFTIYTARELIQATCINTANISVFNYSHIIIRCHSAKSLVQGVKINSSPTKYSCQKC